MDNKVVYCSTRRFDGDDAVKTKLTLDFSGVTEAELIEYAIDALVIKWQSAIRRKKAEKVPAEATYKVPKPGTRQTAMTPFEMLVSLFGKERVLQLVNKAGGEVDKVVKQFKALLEPEADNDEE